MSPVARLIATWLLVMGTAVVVLKALDHVPSLVAGVPRGVRLYRSIEEAERAIGARVWMPGYYPDELRWPPARVEVMSTAAHVVAVRVTGTDGDRDRLAIVQALGIEAVPPSVLPAAQEMATSAVTVGSHAATLSRVLLGTRELHDLSWSQGGRRITLRYAGPVGRLLLIGGSLARLADETNGLQ